MGRLNISCLKMTSCCEKIDPKELQEYQVIWTNLIIKDRGLSKSKIKRTVVLIIRNV